MATGTFILRPSADISVGHTLYPSDSTAAYLLINEETDDGSSTYITSNSSSGLTSKFALSGNIPSELAKVTNIKVVHVSSNAASNYTSIINYSLEIDGTKVSVSDSFSPSDTSYIVYEKNITDTTFLNKLNSSGAFSDLTLTITSSCASNKSYKVNTTQVYLEVTYNTADIGVHKKINGSWVAATQAYQKTNGAWTEITADECKAILQNSLCKRGE